MKTVVVVQTRMGSTRLPGKVLMEAAGKPLLALMLERLTRSRRADEIVVATTVEPEDEAIVELAARCGTPCYRGDVNDLLDRHYQAGKVFGADVVVKVPSDCPLVDPDVVDEVIGYYAENRGRFDFVSNLHPATYPDGLDAEVCSMEVLEVAWREADRPLEREHTTPFIWERPERFRIGNVAMPGGADLFVTERWTLDYPEDYQFFREVFGALYQEREVFHMEAVLALLDAKPEIRAINAHLAGVNWYRHHLDELRTVDSGVTRLHPDERR